MAGFDEAVMAESGLTDAVKLKALEVFHRLYQEENNEPDITGKEMPDMPYDKKPVNKKKICSLCGANTVMETMEKGEPETCLTCGTVQ